MHKIPPLKETYRRLIMDLLNFDNQETDNNLYKVIISLLFGLCGFAVNFLDIVLIETDAFRINILLGLIFPLIISLAWGGRYGLLSALAGGCQAMWWLWSADGWGLLYSVPVFTVWIAWHGWWADKRASNTQHQWYQSSFIVEIPIRIVIESGFYVVFPWLVSFNPPPWNSSITWNNVTTEWINTVVTKHFFTGYVLILVAHALVSVGPVRRFFRIPQERAQNTANWIYASVVLMGLIVWFIESVIASLYFSPRSLMEMMITDIPRYAVFLRGFILISFLAFGTIIVRITQKRDSLHKQVYHLNKVLAGIRNVNQIITKEKDENKLLESVCSSLLETRGFYNAWICRTEDGIPITPCFNAGFNGMFEKMQKNLSKGLLPSCAKRSLNSREVQIISDPYTTCTECPLAYEYSGRAAMTVRLHHDGKTYGWLSVSIPKFAAHDSQEEELLSEVSGDISFALWTIQNEKEKKKIEEQYTTMVRQASDAIMSCTPEGIVTSFNQSAEKLFKCSAKDAIGCHISEFCEQHQCEEQRDILNTVKNEGLIRNHETTRINRQGNIVPVEMTVNLTYDQNGEPTGFTSIIRDITKRKQAEQQVEKELYEKETLLKEVHHRVKNNLNVVVSLLNLQKDDIHSIEDARAALDESSKRIYSMALVHESLYKTQNLSYIEMDKYIRTMVGQLKCSNASTEKVEFEFFLEPVLLDITKAVPCGIVVNELVTNAQKHAFAEKKEGTITLSLKKTNDHYIELSVEDDGKGLPQDFILDQAESLGLSLLKILSIQIDGVIEYSSTSGTKFTVRFPIE